GGWMLKGKMQFRLGSEQRVCGQGDVIVIPGRYRARGMVPRRHRGDRFLCASARGLSTRRQTRLHERGLNSPLRLLSPPDRAHVQFAPRCAPRCERGSSLESKHRCRLGGDCAHLFRPPRADDHRVTSNRSSEATSIGEKLGVSAKNRPCLSSAVHRPVDTWLSSESVSLRIRVCPAVSVFATWVRRRDEWRERSSG